MIVIRAPPAEQLISNATGTVSRDGTSTSSTVSEATEHCGATSSNRNAWRPRRARWPRCRWARATWYRRCRRQAHSRPGQGRFPRWRWKPARFPPSRVHPSRGRHRWRRPRSEAPRPRGESVVPRRLHLIRHIEPSCRYCCLLRLPGHLDGNAAVCRRAVAERAARVTPQQYATPAVVTPHVTLGPALSIAKVSPPGTATGAVSSPSPRGIPQQYATPVEVRPQAYDSTADSETKSDDQGPVLESGCRG